jgi:hypothetical protein
MGLPKDLSWVRFISVETTVPTLAPRASVGTFFSQLICLPWRARPGKHTHLVCIEQTLRRSVCCSKHAPSHRPDIFERATQTGLCKSYGELLQQFQI